MVVTNVKKFKDKVREYLIENIPFDIRKESVQ